MSTSTIQRPFELDSPIQPKRRRYYFRLESESSAASADDTESVYSIQGKETDFVRDTSDTASLSSEYDVDIEYEIASLSDDDDKDITGSSCDESEDVIVATAIVGDSSVEAFITDAEDSDDSRPGESSTGPTDFWICIQCKSQNDHPQYRFCDKCFQDRKAIFPPRPRPRKKAARNKEKIHATVKFKSLQSCLSGLSSQDSGICSSQELDSLRLDQIVIPSSQQASTSLADEDVKNRKRQFSESSLSDDRESQKPRKQAKTTKEESRDIKKETNEKASVVVSEDNSTRTKDEQVKGPLPELKEDCIICHNKPKNSVFLHGRIAHMCCCYSCAMRTWKSLKRCPICQRKVSNVVRVY